MGDKMRQFGLVIFGVITGVMLSLNFSAVADKETAGGPASASGGGASRIH